MYFNNNDKTYCCQGSHKKLIYAQMHHVNMKKENKENHTKDCFLNSDLFLHYTINSVTILNQISNI